MEELDQLVLKKQEEQDWIKQTGLDLHKEFERMDKLIESAENEPTQFKN